MEECVMKNLLILLLTGLVLSSAYTYAENYPDNIINEGERYESFVPDTLDLADRARIALEVLTKNPDPGMDYAGYQSYNFDSNPSYLEWPPGCMEKYIEAMPLMRIMCGSDLNLDVDRNMINSIHGGPRVMQAYMYRYACDNDSEWLERAAKIVDDLKDAALYRADYAYYPLESNFNKETGEWEYTDREEREGRGYLDYYPPDQPTREQQGIEGHVKREMTDVVMSLSRWIDIKHDKKSFLLCEKLMNFVMKPDFWEAGKPPDMVGVEHGIFEGHYHGNIRALRGMLEYAMLTNDKKLKQFIRDGYEYARDFGIARIGWFPAWIYPESYNRPRFYASCCEGCCVADMVAMAVKLCDAGVGDYWEDVDQYVRNQLMEQQVTDINILKAMAKGADHHEIDHSFESADRALERSLGSFMNFAGVSHSGSVAASCCTGNCSEALYYAWEAIVRCEKDRAQINLLLNRASPWLDIASYLPYEGKVVITNKTAKTISVRIPYWVDKNSVKSNINGNASSPYWIENYLVFENMKSKDILTIEFPMVETIEKYKGQSMQELTYEFHFRGNTVVDMSPREEMDESGFCYSYYRGEGRDRVYPSYQRDHLKGSKAPMVKKTQFVSPVIIKWHL